MVEDWELINLLKAMHSARDDDLEDYQKKLFEELWPRLFGFLRAEFPGLKTIDYEDVSEASIIKIFMKIDQYRYEGVFISWCMEIADNTMRDFLKRSSTKRNVVRSFEEIQRQIEADPIEDKEREENELLLDNLDKVLDGLGEECKLIMSLRFWWKFSRKKIAECLGLTEAGLRAKQEDCFESAREMFHILLNE